MYTKRLKIKPIIKSIREGNQLNASIVKAGLTPVTFYAWRKANPRLEMLVKKAQELSDNKRNEIVVDVLFKLAVGGNLGAICFWLKNKAGWRDDQSITAQNIQILINKSTGIKEKIEEQLNVENRI